MDERIQKDITVIISNDSDDCNCNSFCETSQLILSEVRRTGHIVVRLKDCEGGLQRRSHGLGKCVLSEKNQEEQTRRES